MMPLDEYDLELGSSSHPFQADACEKWEYSLHAKTSG